mmetsp:Transcript_18356/g.24556  ORF Transcript_18356/g.24556 Transcript_18356/m.24556 type:complete len:81 (+) Transcript_18356:1232-1474(+)
MGNTSGQGEGLNDSQKQRPPAQYDFGLESLIGRLMEDKPLDSVARSLMTLKINKILKSQDSSEEVATLWKFCDSQFNVLI